MRLREHGVVDQVVVVDALDATGPARSRRGSARRCTRSRGCMPEFGAVLGKGDAMWRALSVLRGDVVCFVDADSEHFGPHFACGLIGPLVVDPDVQFVKGFYRRPFKLGDESSPEGGGRVTELTARPLLQLFYPELGRSTSRLRAAGMAAGQFCLSVSRAGFAASRG